MTWIISIILKYKRFAFPALMVLAIVMLVSGVYMKGRIDGFDNAQRQYQTAQQMAEEKARNEIIRIQSKYDKIFADINAQPDNGINCPLSTYAIKRLHNSGGDK